MKTIKGPAIFLAQFLGEQAPFDTLEGLARWAAGLGYRGVQLPCDARLIDLEHAGPAGPAGPLNLTVRREPADWPP